MPSKNKYFIDDKNLSRVMWHGGRAGLQFRWSGLHEGACMCSCNNEMINVGNYSIEIGPIM